MKRFVALVLIALLGLSPAAALLGLSPAAALAAGSSSTPAVSALPGTTSPFSPGVPVTPTTTPTATTPTVAVPSTTTNGSSSGLSGTGAIAIAIGAIVVLVGISYFIWRDARRHAPVRGGTADSSVDGPSRGSKAPPKPRKLSAAERKRRKRGRAR